MSSSYTAPPHPPLRYKVGATVSPGDRLGLIARGALISGSGTYVRMGQICASILGTVTVTAVEDDCMQDGSEGRWIVSVIRLVKQQHRQANTKNTTHQQQPQVGMVVLGRVTRVIRPSHASVEIVAIMPEQNFESNEKGEGGDKDKKHGITRGLLVLPLREPFLGTLRQSEIKPKSSLEVRIEECVRPGDTILARIRADGEREYILSTAETSLGVVRAVCESSGVVMEAVSWKEMLCPVTMAREARKVAQPRLV